MLGDFLRNLRELSALPPTNCGLGSTFLNIIACPALATLGQWTDEEYRAVLR